MPETKLQPPGRLRPLILFVFVATVLALHHWYVLTQHQGYALVLFVMPPLGMLALGGLVYPPMMNSVGQHGRAMPTPVKVAGYLLLLSGLGIGYYLFRFVYGF